MARDERDAPQGSSGWDVLGGLAVGALGGFLLGVMLSPRTRDTAPDGVADTLTDVRDRTRDVLENLRGNTEALLNQTRIAIEERINLLNEAVEAGKKAAEYKRAELIEQETP
ncbi:MAG: hypothetical protein VKP62_02455 [Candidatus Sericytochromatia bacterium]|nr:hypothetical protein [Candidatus Sericytochromatia bacterium]